MKQLVGMPKTKKLKNPNKNHPIIACAVDHEDPSHILSCLPTGYGKSIPMLLLSLFLPPGMTYDIYREGLTEMLSQKD